MAVSRLYKWKVDALTIPKDQPVSIERAMIGSTRTCRIFAGLCVLGANLCKVSHPAHIVSVCAFGKATFSGRKGGNFNFSTGNVLRLSFWAFPAMGIANMPQNPRK